MTTLKTLGSTQSAILRLLRRKGSASRAELALACGITPAAVSMTTRGLMSAGLIKEGARRTGGRGAPHIELRLSGSAGQALGVHATRHSISLALLDFRGAVIVETRHTGNFDNFAPACDAIIQGAHDLRGCTDTPLIGAGIAMPTRFHSSNHLDLAQEVAAWASDDPEGRLRQALGCPVFIENDANAAAIGEFSLGNHQGYQDFSYLYLSEGIGSALILNGALHRGHFGNAGEVGALRPRGLSRPSFEDLADFCALHSPPQGRDHDQWQAFLQTNTKLAEAWLARATPEVAQILFAISAIVAPAAICIGGTLPLTLRQSMADQIDLSQRDQLYGGTVRPPNLILPDIKTEDAVAFGAAAAVLHRL